MPTHTRIRMFNTKETYPNQALNNDLCQACLLGLQMTVFSQSLYVSFQISSSYRDTGCVE